MVELKQIWKVTVKKVTASFLGILESDFFKMNLGVVFYHKHRLGNGAKSLVLNKYKHFFALSFLLKISMTGGILSDAIFFLVGDIASYDGGAYRGEGERGKRE